MASTDNTKHLIIGTAGHVDHGKTTLIKAITGTNTDRLKEEQERGLTIDLGFASLRLPSGRQVGIVDVPGHERFLKNMLAGASGVDIALLVVAADEGVMPQTKEHLEILELLETKQGVIALTKCDMVDEEWLEIVEEDIRTSLKDSFLAGANIIPVSGTTGKGTDALLKELDRLANQAEQRSIEGPFRLPIDRVFTMTGFGTVVTGTLVSGTLKIGDPVVVIPQNINSRIRQLQVHGKKQEIVYAGSRVAANLVGIDVEDLERGDVVLPPGYLQATNILDAAITVLKDSPKPLKSRMRIRLHIGTAEIIGRAMILGTQEIKPGDSGFVQLRLETPVVAARGDRFVLRFYSPMRVMGGGKILDPATPKHRLNDQAAIKRLEHKLKGDPLDIIEDTLSANEMGLNETDLIKLTGMINKELTAALSTLTSNEQIIQLAGRYLHKSAYQGIIAKTKAILETYHTANPMRSGMPKEELRRQLSAKLDTKTFQTILTALSSDNEIAFSDTIIKLPNFQPTLNETQTKTATNIEDEYRNAGANPPLISEIEQKHGTDSKEILSLLIDKGTLIKVTPEFLFHTDAIKQAEDSLTKHLQANSQITVAEFRDLIISSRKYVVPLLEYFDAKKVTRRMGDIRVLAK